ncbi:FHA domain-containing protein [Pseudonocardia sp. CA-107938]|uniref:FHA domain-containing protein n=1 Tax=Pseudonocardia sp. CA-107938 TaxID=3240021 RepID=UPI003D9396A8
MRELSARSASLAFEPPSSPPGTIFVLGPRGGVSTEPTPGATITFGRNIDDVDVVVAPDDDRVSRRHGVLTRAGRSWTLANTGRLPIRLPGSRMVFPDSEPVELAVGYTPMFIRSRHGRDHLVEVRITGATGVTRPRHKDLTSSDPIWALNADERLVLVVLGQRYLRHDAHPQPLSWRQVADELNELLPDQGWTAKRAEHIGVAVRKRLSAAGVPGLTRDEVGDPVGNALNHNLMLELVSSATLVPPDLRVLDELEL